MSHREDGVQKSENTSQGMDPTGILALSTGYWDSQALLTANRIGLFACLGVDSKSVEQIAQELGTKVKVLRLFLNACVALGLLKLNEGRYANTRLSQAFLVPGHAGFLGDALRYSDDLYATWGKLETCLKTGEPQLPAEVYTGTDKKQTRHFVYGMHNRALGIGRMMVELVDLSGRSSMIDVGGGPGTYSSLFAQRYPQLRSQVLDLPGVLEVAEEVIKSLGMSDQVTTKAMDYKKDEFPSGKDVVLISGVFHRETEETCRGFIRRAFQALKSGGMVVVSDVFTDQGGTGPLFATMFGINMMLTAVDGGVHSDGDVAGWIEAGNFSRINVIPFPQPMPHRRQDDLS
jgi:2-polyprenyl-3-methyl-5-hydroxy-6-metoxy-1,4-benzoquinol methylase